LMAGLGAYGGAGLGEALATSGMQQAGAEQLAKTTAGLNQLPNDAILNGMPQQEYVNKVLAQTQPYVDARTAAQTAYDTGSFTDKLGTMGQGVKSLGTSGGLSNLYQNLGSSPMSRVGAVAALAGPTLAQQDTQAPVAATDKDMGQRYRYNSGVTTPQPAPDLNPYGGSGREQRYYTSSYEPISNDEAKSLYHFADGGATPQNPAVPQFAMPKDNPNAGALNLFKDMQEQSAAQNKPAASYFQTNPDVAESYKQNNYGMTPADFAATHYQKFGVNEGRAAPPEFNVAQSYAAYTKNLTAPPAAVAPIKPVAGVTSTVPTGDPNATPNYAYNPTTKTFTNVVAPKPITPISDVNSSGEPYYNLPSDGQPSAYADGGSTTGNNPVERMSNANAVGANTGFPQAYMPTNQFAIPTQTPVAQNVLMGAGDVRVDPYTGEKQMATGGISDAHYNLGGYSDGGRLLRGPGDGVSDSIPATIGHKQPARLADGEFVVPARIVSELGNGSTEAGARKLYAMMDRVQAARRQTVGKGKVAKNSRSEKYLPV
jgi:hypothetical protein